MTLSVNEQVELGSIISDLYQISRVCTTLLDENLIQLSEQTSLSRAIRDNAQTLRDSLQTSVEQYKQLERKPFISESDLFNLKKYINTLVLTDYQQDIIPNFEEFTKQVLDKEDAIKKIVEKSRQIGAPILAPTQIEKELQDAKSEIAALPKKGTFNDISSFASKAKPYVEKIIKGAKIALTVLGMFV